MKVKQLLNKPQKWCKKTYARNSKGKAVDIDAGDACRFCLSGAIKKCYGSSFFQHTQVYRIVDDIVRELFDSGVVEFNDNPKTTFKDIQKVLRKAKV